MNRPYIPEYRKANITRDFNEIALSLCCCYPLGHYLDIDPKYVPFGKSYAKGQYYTFDGMFLPEYSIETYISSFAALNNLNRSAFIIDAQGYPRDYNLPCRCWTVKDWLEVKMDDYEVISSYEKAFKDIFNLEYKKDKEITTQNLEKYVHIMKCVDPDNNNITFNVASTAELSNLVKSYVEMLEDNNRISFYFDEY